jgi:Zn-dependent protease
MLSFSMEKGARLGLKCEKCGQETFLPFQCPYCDGQFCAAHRLPENHACPKMGLARAPKQEAPVVLQGPSSYEHTVTFGQPRRVKGRIYFSPKELKHLVIAALLVVGIGLSAGLYSDVFAQVNWTLTLVAFTAILTASFFMHEIAHKITAQRRGLWAEFRLTLWGAVLTLLSVISPFFKIISPGAVMISGSARNDEIGKISLAGPATNIVLSTVLLGVAFMPSPFFWVLLFGSFFNAASIALFNLIPIGILDGFKIFGWDKKVWGLAFAASLALTVASGVLLF